MSFFYLILCLLVFGFLIVTHELGHFLAAKLCGVRVNEFSFGMGPLLWHTKRGETQYSIRLVPVGGYCAMEGEDTESSDPRAFGNAKSWQKFLILIAGAGFNFLTGLIVVVLLFTSVEQYATTTLRGFMDGFPLQGEEYLMEGDEILAINGRRVLLNGDITTILTLENSESVDLTIRRNGERKILEDLPLVLRDFEVNGQTVRRYGLYFEVAEATALDRLRLGLYNTFDFVRQVFWSFEMLANGTAGVKDLSGPVGIVSTMTEVGNNSPSVLEAVENILYFGAFVAVNLSVMNILPLPALDGGRILFLLLNVILGLLFRRTIPERFEGAVHLAGLVMLLALMGVVAVNDIYKIVT